MTDFLLISFSITFVKFSDVAIIQLSNLNIYYIQINIKYLYLIQHRSFCHPF